jgi:hypothetical protein
MVHLRYAFASGFALIIFPDHRFDCPMTPNRKLCWPEVLVLYQKRPQRRN